MSQSFRFRYEQMRENIPPEKTDASHAKSAEADEFYNFQSNTRNVCFTLPGGDSIFLNYSYLIAGEYRPQDNAITLTFTTHILVLNGIHLEKLFYDFMQHLPRQIICVDKRYNTLEEKENPVVNTIEVKTSNG